MGVPPHGSSPAAVRSVAASTQESCHESAARAEGERWQVLGAPAFAKAPARSRRSAMNDKRAQAEGPSAK